MSKYRQIDGLVEFGHGSYTFHAQLATAGTINQNVFGLCNAGFESPLALVTLGKFDFGDDMPVLGQTPLLRGGQWATERLMNLNVLEA